MTADEAISNAVRLLQAAEQETNLAIAESITRIAEGWIATAQLLDQ
jgi:hypothetical protein